MSLVERFKDFLDGGYARNRREAVKEIEQNSVAMAAEISQLRAILHRVLVNPKQARDLFDLQIGLHLQDVREKMDELRRMKTEEGRFNIAAMMASLQYMFLLADIEAVNTAQHVLFVQMIQLVDALKTQTIIREDLASKLDTIRKELEQKMPTDEDLENIEWMRDFIRKSAQTEGQGS